MTESEDSDIKSTVENTEQIDPDENDASHPPTIVETPSEEVESKVQPETPINADNDVTPTAAGFNSVDNNIVTATATDRKSVV